MHRPKRRLGGSTNFGPGSTECGPDQTHIRPRRAQALPNSGPNWSDAAQRWPNKASNLRHIRPMSAEFIRSNPASIWSTTVEIQRYWLSNSRDRLCRYPSTLERVRPSLTGIGQNLTEMAQIQHKSKFGLKSTKLGRNRRNSALGGATFVLTTRLKYARGLARQTRPEVRKGLRQNVSIVSASRSSDLGADFGQNLARYRQMPTKLLWPGLVERGANFDNLRPILGPSRPFWTRVWPRVAEFDQIQARLGRIWVGSGPTLAEHGQSCGAFGQFRPKSLRCRSVPAKLWSISVEIEPSFDRSRPASRSNSPRLRPHPSLIWPSDACMSHKYCVIPPAPLCSRPR